MATHRMHAAVDTHILWSVVKLPTPLENTPFNQDGHLLAGIRCQSMKTKESAEDTRQHFTLLADISDCILHPV